MTLAAMDNIKDRVLIVEDEQDIASLIQVHLNELDLNAEICGDGTQALEKALNQDYQLIILDVMLPGINGLDICRQVRDAKPLQSILMLTSRTSETDRVLGLELGADDYITKPFSIRELQARVRCQLRKMHCIAEKNKALLAQVALDQATLSQENSAQGAQVFDEEKATCIGQLMIDHSYHQVTHRQEVIELTSTEYDLLSFLGKHPDQVFSRSQLLDSVWGYHHSGYEHTVNSHINRLRNKLEENSAQPQIIQTVWGVGYKLNSSGVV